MEVQMISDFGKRLLTRTGLSAIAVATLAAGLGATFPVRADEDDYWDRDRGEHRYYDRDWDRDRDAWRWREERREERREEWRERHPYAYGWGYSYAPPTYYYYPQPRAYYYPQYYYPGS